MLISINKPLKQVLILALASFFVSKKIDAQITYYDSSWFNDKKLSLGASFITLGIFAEYNFKKTQTIRLLLDGNPHFSSLATSGGKRENSLVWNPHIIADYRYYYNIERRKRLEKNISYFSGNYLGITTQVLLVPRNRVIVSDVFAAVQYRYHYTGLQYGIQRAFGKAKKWFVDFNVGVGWRFYTKDAPYSPIGIWGYAGLGRRID
ncbi:MAG: hypothetical protein ACLGGV_01000 [Bacteroidia bacterium]